MPKPPSDPCQTAMEERLGGEGGRQYKAAVLQHLDVIESRLRVSMATRLVPEVFSVHLAAAHAVECARKFLDAWDVPSEGGMPSPAAVTAR